MRDDKERLRDINEAIEKIEKYVSIGYQAFAEGRRRTNASLDNSSSSGDWGSIESPLG